MDIVEELCISGGSTRGISFVGALIELENEKLLKKENLKKCIGTSIGSFILCLYLIGYTTDEMFSLMMKTDVSLFNEYSINNQLSILKGQIFHRWIINTIDAKEDSNKLTFKSLYDKTGVNFIIVQACLNKGLVLMNYMDYPDILIKDALIASMSLPFIFPPHIICDEIYVDGGLLENFAVFLLSRKGYGITGSNPETKSAPTTVVDLVKSIRNTIYNHSTTGAIIRTNNIINIIYNVNIINFDIDNDDKVTLYKIGSIYTKNFINIKKNQLKLLEEIKKKNSENFSEESEKNSTNFSKE